MGTAYWRLTLAGSARIRHVARPASWGNSLLGYNIFGRRAGIEAAKQVSKTQSGKAALDHLTNFKKLLADGGLKPTWKAPMLIPDYRGKEALSRSIDIL